MNWYNLSGEITLHLEKGELDAIISRNINCEGEIQVQDLVQLIQSKLGKRRGRILLHGGIDDEVDDSYLDVKIWDRHEYKRIENLIDPRGLFYLCFGPLKKWPKLHLSRRLAKLFSTPGKIIWPNILDTNFVSLEQVYDLYCYQIKPIKREKLTQREVITLLFKDRTRSWRFIWSDYKPAYICLSVNLSKTDKERDAFISSRNLSVWEKVEVDGVDVTQAKWEAWRESHYMYELFEGKRFYNEPSVLNSN